MQWSLIIVVVALSLCFLALFSGSFRRGTPKDVVSIDIKDGKSAQAFLDSGRGLLMIHAPWCGHCKHMMPEFEKAAKMIEEDKSSTKIVKIDHNAAGRDFLSKHSVGGFPTIFEVKNGVKTLYKGARTAQALADAARRV